MSLWFPFGKISWVCAYYMINGHLSNHLLHWLILSSFRVDDTRISIREFWSTKKMSAFWREVEHSIVGCSCNQSDIISTALDVMRDYLSPFGRKYMQYVYYFIFLMMFIINVYSTAAQQEYPIDAIVLLIYASHLLQSY